MTYEVKRICRDLHRAGRTLQSISSTVRLPIRDVERAIA